MQLIDIQGTNVDGIPRPLVAVGLDAVSCKYELHEHHHEKCELIYTVKGLLSCEADGHIWTIPPQCALWIPSRIPHRSWAFGRIESYALFIAPDLDTGLGNRCCAVTVSTLLRELLFRVASSPALYPSDGPEARLLPVVIDELSMARKEQLRVPMPADPTLRRLANLVMSNPMRKASVAEWATQLSMSERTLSRRFSQEIGMSFGQWRHRVHVTLALQWMADGRSIKSIAFNLGYESASSFITMFKKTLGQSPARYLAQREDMINDLTPD
ncbi:helix-turn-helix domain-containing protein [Xanthomonas axonopodis]|uniref:helix-turn-helix domain-containing protein n=1 Tax=Xanthomonas axonopodis TaxID=53413 RepID=UPI0035581C4D